MAYMKRLQGKEWQEIKKNVKLIGYFENKGNGRIKVFTRVKVPGGMIIYHWLNDTERAKFEEHKHKYPVMNDKGEIVTEAQGG